MKPRFTPQSAFALASCVGSIAAAQQCYLTPIGASPPVQFSSSMAAYDTVRSRTLVAQWGALGPMKLYAWTGSTWTLLSANGPTQRLSPAMAYDSGRDKLVVFGGRSSAGPIPFPNDVWEWNGESWATISVPSAVIGRQQHAMCYDSVRQRVVMYGGEPFAFGTSGVWEWNGAEWSSIQTPQSSIPGPRSQPHLTFDSARARIQLHGGFTTSGLDDFWEWDGTSWTQLPDAPAQSGYVFTYDPSRARTLFMERQNAWEYDAAAGLWTSIVKFHPATVNGLYNIRPVHDTALNRIVFPLGQGLRVWNGGGSEEPIAILSLSGGGPYRVGSIATFSITIAGSGNIGYQWFKDGVPVVDGGHITGAQSPHLRLSPVSSLLDTGTYHAQTTNSCGTVSSFGMHLYIPDCQPLCYANCDGSTGCPALTANDFMCYITAYTTSASYANCDSTGGLTTSDFMCFLNAWYNGCS